MDLSRQVLLVPLRWQVPLKLKKHQKEKRKMKIKEKFENLVASMKVDYKKLPKADQEYSVANKVFTTEYEKFKKEHGLENM